MSYASRSATLRYGIALLAVAVGLAARHLLVPLLGSNTPFVTVFPAVVVAAWFGGWKAGLLAVVAGAGGATLLFGGAITLPEAAAVNALVFVGSAVLMVLVTESLHRAEAFHENAQQQLERERARLDAIVSSVPGVVWEAWGQPDTGEQRIDYVSPYVEQMLGYSREQWLGTPNFWLGLVHPDDRERAAAEAGAIFAGGKAGVSEFRWITRDGRTLWVHAQSSVIKDEAGRPLGMRGVTLDITARRMAEERLRAVADVAETLAELGPDPDEVAGRIARRVTEVLPGACTVRRLDGERLHLAAAHHADPEAQPLLVPFSEELVRQGVYAGVVHAGRTWHPDRFDVAPVRGALAPELSGLAERFGGRRLVVAPMKSRGRVLGTLAVWRDDPPYTEADALLLEAMAGRAGLAIENARLYAEAEHARRDAEHASRLKDEFLTTLSHELRTPLNAIVGWAHMLRAGGMSGERLSRAAEVIHRNAMAQTQLVSDILDMQRIVSGKLRLALREVDLADIVRAAADTVTPAARAKEVQLSLMLDPDAGPSWGDPDRLQQVAWNLLSNAVKFSPRGGRVQARLYRAGSLVELAVEDDGPGIPAEFLPFVFDRFRQADSSSTREHGGLGVGLAIVRSLVELHGGVVEARNVDEGTGAVFTVRLPRPRATTATPVLAAASPPRGAVDEAPAWLGSAPSLAGTSVLVIDDDPDGRELVAAVLGECGAEVLTAASGADGLEIVGRRGIDVVVCDIHMPGMDGYTFIRRMRGLPVGHHTPAAALTAAATVADRMHALAAGFQMHVAKPVQPAELATVVASLAAVGRGLRRVPPAPESPA